MIITHLGKQHFQIKQGDLVVAFNPDSQSSKSKADLVLITTDTFDYNNLAAYQQVGQSPFVISGPGEYEVQNIFVKGFGTFVNLPLDIKSKETIRLQNTSYVLTIDNIKICFLGCLHEELLPEQREMIDEVDILFIPTSANEDILNSYDAHKLATKLEPKLIIPMDYNESSLKIFLQELGQEKIEKIEKLTLKKKDLDDKTGEVVVFKI